MDLAAAKAALEKALASGHLTVEYDGKRVTYRSIEEIKKALAYVQQEIDAASAAGVVTQSFAAYSGD